MHLSNLYNIFTHARVIFEVIIVLVICGCAWTNAIKLHNFIVVGKSAATLSSTEYHLNVK